MFTTSAVGDVTGIGFLTLVKKTVRYYSIFSMNKPRIYCLIWCADFGKNSEIIEIGFLVKISLQS